MYPASSWSSSRSTRQFFRPIEHRIDAISYVREAPVDRNRRRDAHRLKGRAVGKRMPCRTDEQRHAVAKSEEVRLAGTTLRGFTDEGRTTIVLERHDEILAC